MAYFLYLLNCKKTLKDSYSYYTTFIRKKVDSFIVSFFSGSSETKTYF